ncbi:MAG: hypothetical protein J3R72DRAFT_446540 [Linnemannia gamsii]|nr:MAG: hypothetical protein J3R72DRAFT_446540 [Linnemannia gamsii]
MSGCFSLLMWSLSLFVDVVVVEWLILSAWKLPHNNTHSPPPIGVFVVFFPLASLYVVFFVVAVRLPFRVLRNGIDSDHHAHEPCRHCMRSLACPIPHGRISYFPQTHSPNIISRPPCSPSLSYPLSHQYGVWVRSFSHDKRKKKNRAVFLR